jgi:hypothetical protein
MREATKGLTSFTNKWKRFPEKLEEMYKSSTYIDLGGLRQLTQILPMSKSRKLDGIMKFEPKYPEPAQEKTSVRVSFVAFKKDVSLLSKHFFDEQIVKPGDVGEAAFNEALKQAKRSNK